VNNNVVHRIYQGNVKFERDDEELQESGSGAQKGANRNKTIEVENEIEESANSGFHNDSYEIEGTEVSELGDFFENKLEQRHCR